MRQADLQCKISGNYLTHHFVVCHCLRSFLHRSEFVYLPWTVAYYIMFAATLLGSDKLLVLAKGIHSLSVISHNSA